MVKKAVFFISLLLLFCASRNPASALTIKMGSLMPVGSPWDNALKELAAAWRSISGNRVNLKIYPGGIAGSEPDMIRKMRINQLQAAGLTGVGLFRIDPSVLIVQLPMFVRSDEELDYVLKNLRPTFEKEMEEKGFKVIAWTMVGWAHFFARDPVITPADLMRQKLHVPAGNEREILALKKLGFQVVPLPITDVMMALQSGMIDAFMSPPLAAAAFQWFGLAKNMCSLRWAPVLGGIVISTRAWGQIQDDLKPRLLEAALKVERSMRSETLRVEQEALTVMERYGLIINPVSIEAEKAWLAVVQKGFDLIAGKSFNREIYDQVKGHLLDFRKNKPYSLEKSRVAK